MRVLNLPMNNSRLLPSAYLEVQYLENTATAWIDTGIHPDSDTKLEIKASFSDLTLGAPHIAYVMSDSIRYGILKLSNARVRFDFETDLSTTTFLLILDHANTYIIYKGISIDGTSYKTSTKTFSQIASSLILFGGRYGSTVNTGYIAKGKIYYSKFSKNGVELQHLIPCKRKSDSKPGMYDLVTNTFLVNQGTGTDFTCGPEGLYLTVASERNNLEVPSLLPEGIELYDSLISSDGNQFIDTLVCLTTLTAKTFKVEFTAKLHNSTTFGGWPIYGYDVPDFSIGLNASKQFVCEGGSNYRPNSGQNDSAYALLKMTYIADYKNGHAYLKDESGTAIYDLNIGTNNSNTFYGYGYTLFGSRTNLGALGNVRCVSTLYSCRMWDNDILVRNFLPCTYNGVAGLWDTVTHKFYGNQGSGSFTLGTKILLKLYEYLESSGTLYINTNLLLLSNIQSECKLKVNVVAGSTGIFGFYKGGGPSNFLYVNPRILYGFTTLYINCDINWDTDIHTIIITNGKLYKDSELLKTLTVGTSNLATTPIYIFSLSGGNYNKLNGRIYYLKLYSANNLIHNFIPCSYNGENGLWDRIEMKFYGNSGSGTFTVGSEVKQITSIATTNVSCITDNTCPNKYKLVFNFTGNTSKIGPITVPALNNNYTISWWEYTTNFNGGYMPWGFGNGNRLNPIYSKCLNTGDGSDNPWLQLGTTTKINDVTNSVWHHFVITGNGTANYLYIDGIKVGQSKTYKACTGTELWFNGWNNATNYSGAMKLSDFKIFNTALTDEEVKHLYTGGEGL